MARALRYSRQRERIYEYLAASKEHPSAEMIYTDLREEIPDLSIGTVYRNLRLLEQTGKVRKVMNQNGNDRYDALCEEHAHFICQDCGSIIDIFDVDEKALRACVSLGEGYQLAQMDMMMTGRCPSCTQRVSN